MLSKVLLFTALVLSITHASIANVVAQSPTSPKVMGQSPTSQNSTTQTPATQTPAADTPRSNISVSVNPGGMRYHVPSKWATMSVSGSNYSDQDANELVTIQLGDETTHQFARRLWIPAQARRQAWVPVKVPDIDMDQQKRVEMTSIRLQESAESESFQANAVGQPLSKRSLLLSRPGSQTAVFSQAPKDSLRSQMELQTLLDTIYILRDETATLTNQSPMVNYTNSFLPPYPQALDSLNQIILTGDGMLRDSTSVARLGQWIRDGGQLWIMVDRIQQGTLQRLLGDDNCFTELDRVELNELQMHHVNGTTGDTVLSSDWQSDQPVELVRGVADADQVLCSIDNWPAAFTKQIGSGEVLFTTVGARSLIKDQLPLSAFRTTAGHFFTPTSKAERHASVMTSLVDNQIGYRVPSRSTIAAILGSQLLFVLIIGIWLLRTRRLDRMAIVIPLTVVAAAACLVWTGKRNAGSVPPTFASGQFARVILGGSEVLVDSISAVYSDTTQTLDLTASPQTVMSLQEASTSNSRLVWNDDGSSTWMHLTQPPGVVRHIASESHTRLPTPWTFNGRFTQRGFEGQLGGIDSSTSQDAVVVSNASPSLALIADGETWVGEPNRILSQGQYAGDSLLTDLQRQRQAVVRDFGSQKKRLFGRQPMLLFWTDAKQLGLTIGAPFTQKGSSLVAMPIRFQQTPPGTTFRIPATFLRTEVSFGDEGFSTLFNSRTGQWLQGRTQAQSTGLSCFLPPSVLPCKLTSAQIQIKLSAPSRSLEIATGSGDDYAAVLNVDNPNGLIDFSIDDAQRLLLDQQGGLSLRIAVSETAEEKAANGGGPKKLRTADDATPNTLQGNEGLNNRIWQIEFLRVTLEGVTQ